MRDEHWISAIRTYPSEEGRTRSFLHGGAPQLAQVLETLTKEDPIRYARLATRLPDDASSAYFEAILRGVAAGEHDVPLESVRALVVRCDALPGRPCGRWIAGPLRRFAAVPLPVELIRIVSWYGSQDPDPPRDSEPPADAESVDDYSEIDNRGLNSVRGGIAYELAVLVSEQPANLDAFAGLIDQLVSDPAPSVRAMAARPLTAALRHDPDRAVRWFRSLATHPDDRVLAGTEVHEFLRYAAPRSFEQLRGIIERMIASPNRRARTNGAIQAALVALDGREAQDLVARCAAGDAATRLGLAKVNAANIASAAHRAGCECQLERLFDDENADVRAAAAEVFHELAELDFDRAGRLVTAFLNSAAFDVLGAETLLTCLDMAASPPPEIVIGACQAVIGATRRDREAPTGAVAIHNAVELAIRAYADAAGDLELRNAALDVIDRLLELDTYGITSAIEAHDR